MWGLLGNTTRTLFLLASDEDTLGGEWDFPNEELPCFPLPPPPPIELGELLPPDREDGEQGLWYPFVVALFISNMVPDDEGRGEHADWGESWFGWRRLELSWGKGDELSGRFTGTGDIPDEDACIPHIQRSSALEGKVSNQLLTRVPFMWALLCIIKSNSSLILLYLASDRGVNVYCESSGSGESQPLLPPFKSFLERACDEFSRWIWFIH